jgi:hypothetical protein
MSLALILTLLSVTLYPMVKRATWLSVTPEPERELPEAVATLAVGHRPAGDDIARQRARIERLVLRGSQRQWLRYLHEVVRLIDCRVDPADPDVVRARARAAAVIANHHNLLLGLPGRGADRTAGDRATLRRLEQTTHDHSDHRGSR